MILLNIQRFLKFKNAINIQQKNLKNLKNQYIYNQQIQDPTKVQCSVKEFDI